MRLVSVVVSIDVGKGRFEITVFSANCTLCHRGLLSHIGLSTAVSHAWKACKRESVSRVRIPLCPCVKTDPVCTKVQAGFCLSPGDAVPRVAHRSWLGRRNARGEAVIHLSP